MTTEQVKLCSREGCTNPVNPKSTKGYCTECMKAAKDAWFAMIREQAAVKAERAAEWARLWDQAVEAGIRAELAVQPAVFQVVDALSKKVQGETFAKGFAGLRIVPGNSAFANWLTAHHGATRLSGGGVQVSIWAEDQSVERAGARAGAMAAVLDAGEIGHARVRSFAEEC